MPILLLIAASSLPSQMVMPLDNAEYPVQAMREGREAMIITETIVSPAGYPLNCRVVVSGGADFDTLTCNSIMHRGRYKPALDDAGKPTYGVVRNRHAWTMGGMPHTPPPILDLTLTMRPITGIKLPATSSVILSVGPDGRVTGCEAAQVPGERKLVQTSCDQAKRLPPFPAINFDGQPVSSVRSITIGYQAGN